MNSRNGTPAFGVSIVPEPPTTQDTRPQAASPQGLVLHVPRSWYPWLVVLVLLLMGGAGGALANALAIWHVPGRTEALEERVERIEGTLAEVARALGVEPASQPAKGRRQR